MQQTFEKLGTVGGGEKRMEIGLNGLRRKSVREFVTAAQGATRDIWIGQHRLAKRSHLALPEHIQQGLNGLRRAVIVDVAVGERHGSQLAGVACSENLSDAAAAVVADELHLVQIECFAEFGQHVGLG